MPLRPQNARPTRPSGPDPVAESLQRGMAAHQAGDLVEAARLYKVVLRKRPDQFDALHLLGMAEAQRGRLDKAERLMRDALAHHGGVAEVWSNLGNVQHQRGRLEEALASFERALALAPGFATAHNNRGSVLLALGRPQEALAAFDAAFAADPSFADVLHNRGIALRQMRQPEAALENFDRVLAMHPAAAQVHADRGAVLAELGRHAEALAAFDEAIAREPGHAEAHYNRGVTLVALGRFDEALAGFDNAIAMAPQLGAAHANRGNVLVQLGRLDDALAAFDRALDADPGLLGALSEKGHAAQAGKRYELAADTFERLVARDGDYPYALGNLLYARAYCCDWTAFGVLRSLVMQGAAAGKRTVFPGHLLALAPTAAEQLVAAETWVADHYAAPLPALARPGLRHERIRLAYVSANFHEHPMPMLLAGLFERHDRDRFETTAISLGADDGSAMRRRLEGAFDRFIDGRTMSDEAIAALMSAAEIDIAVDLMGFTEGSRPGIFLRRPAAVQAGYMGYCGTTALPSHDYFIADKVVIPPEHAEHYSEKIVWLPETYYVNDDTRAIGDEVPGRTEAGLPESGFVYCCFNNNFKISPETFASWMRILAAVEGSVLWLIEPNATALRNLRESARAHGVAPERLIFAPRVSPAAHLARHCLADLSLDTLPYNAHTTACDSLWTGVPLVTQLGEAFPGRVAASILHAVGLSELVTGSGTDFEALAIALAHDPARLAALKEKLAANRMTQPLFDTDRFRRHIEAAYVTMQERHLRGEAPAGFAVAPID